MADTYGKITYINKGDTDMTTNQIIKTGKHDAKGNELALTHYSKGVWKVLGLQNDGTAAWFIPTTSKAQALARIDWLATERA